MPKILQTITYQPLQDSKASCAPKTIRYEVYKRSPDDVTCHGAWNTPSEWVVGHQKQVASEGVGCKASPLNKSQALNPKPYRKVLCRSCRIVSINGMMLLMRLHRPYPKEWFQG